MPSILVPLVCEIPAAHPELELPEVTPQLEVLQEREKSVRYCYIYRSDRNTVHVPLSNYEFSTRVRSPRSFTVQNEMIVTDGVYRVSDLQPAVPQRLAHGEAPSHRHLQQVIDEAHSWGGNETETDFLGED